MNALVYARVSTKEQENSGSSLSSQVEACKKFALDNDYRIIKSVAESFSGAYLFDRPKLNECRDEIRAGLYDALIVYDIDRLSRNITHLGVLLDECERYNVKLLFVNGDLDETPEGKLLMSIRGYLAEAERHKTIERTVRGRRAKAKQGTLSFKRKLYGYQLDNDGKRVIDDIEGKIIEFLFSEFLGGSSLRSIAAELNKRGVPVPSGKSGAVWWAYSINHILKNPAYCGKTTVFRQKKSTRFVKGKRIVSTHHTDKNDWQELPDVTPSIISVEAFDLAQVKLAENRQSKRRAPKREFLLRGFIQCAVCGRAMSPQVSYKWRAYVCTSKQNPATNCGVKMLNAEKAENLVWTHIEGILTEPKRVERFINRASKNDAQRRKDLGADVESIGKSIAKVKNEIHNLVMRAESANDTVWQIFSERLAMREKELSRLNSLHAEAIDRLSAYRATTTDIADFHALAAKVNARMGEMSFTEKTKTLNAFIGGLKWDGETLKMDVEIPTSAKEKQYDSKSDFDGF